MNGKYYHIVFLKKYILMSLRQLGKVRETKTHYNFRCNICGDSKISKRKKRGYILTTKIPWVFKCHNCGISMLAETWLKKYFPQYYRQYIKDILQNKKDENTITEQLKVTQKKENKKNEIKNKKIEKKNTKKMVPILSGTGTLFENAKLFCQKRKIPYSVWKDWYVSIDGFYKNRLIIPFYNKDKRIYYFQGRTLTDQIPKYLNRIENRDNAIYNYSFINKSNPVIVLEGVIDSLYIENAIAVIGTKVSEVVDKKLNKLNCYYIWDNDEAGNKTSIKYLKKKKPVFIWKKFLKENNIQHVKDINDFILETKIQKILFKDIERFFTTNYYDRIYF